MARREGDVLEFARAVLIFAYRTEDVRNDLVDLKYLPHSCSNGDCRVSVPYSSSENLTAQIDLLRNEYALISNNFILWGFKNVSMDIVNTVNAPKGLFSMIILHNPEEISLKFSSINPLGWHAYSKNSMQTYWQIHSFPI